MQLTEHQLHTAHYFSVAHTRAVVRHLFLLLLICLTAKHRVSSYSRLLKEMRETSLLPFLSFVPLKKESSRTLPC